MQLRFKDFDDFVVFFKPNGIRMHQVDDGHFGFVEAVSQKLAAPLYIVHRLDKETSGLVLFAKNKDSASLLSELFEDHLIQKTYFFLTDRKPDEKFYLVKSHIEKKQNRFVNTPGLPPNSETLLEYVQPAGDFHLWKAIPKSGKPHQIRLHAESMNIPILGDPEHGGAPWFRLCLHASRLNFTLHGKSYSFESEIPPSFKKPDPLMIRNLLDDAFFNRSELFHLEKHDSFRLLHLEFKDLRVDIFNDHLWVYDYSANGLTHLQQTQIQNFANDQHLHSVIRHMLDRGQGVGGLEQTTLQQSTPETTWHAFEEKIQYVLKTNSGFSPGLFLDQRENRQWIRKMALDKNVLNLFSYTSGFSVAAALGGAQQVTSVDASKKFLEWSKENFKANALSSEKYEFFAQDCMLFLKGAQKRHRTWNLIICDPPSFGRSQDSIWKIEKNLGELSHLIWNCLAVNGQLLFTCNYEKWTRHELIAEFSKNLPHGKFKLDRLPLLSLDFGETDDTQNLMKGFLLTRLS